MKRIYQVLVLIFVVLFFSDCKRKDGYNCDKGVCRAESKNAQYLSLADCKSDCQTATQNNNAPGKVAIHVKWDYVNCSFNVLVGIGYSSTDVTNNAYIDKKEENVGSVNGLNYNKDGLAPGTYYYKVVRTRTYGNCSSNPVTKISAFVVNAGQETSIDVWMDQ